MSKACPKGQRDRSYAVFELPGHQHVLCWWPLPQTREFAILFKRKPKPPLSQALDNIHEAVEIAYRYLRDWNHHPTEDELKLLEQFRETLWSSHATVEYISRCLHQRANGEPEGAKKFTDPDAFNDHYP